MSTQTAFTDTRRFKVMRTVIGAANPFIKAMLGSRFAGPVGKALLLLRFTGRTSGKVYTTPVGYVREGDSVVVVTSPTYTWWKNVRDGADVEVRLDGAWRKARARVLPTDDPAFDRAVAIQVKGRGPGMLRGFGVAVDDDGTIPPEARADMDRKALIVLIELQQTAAAS
ncbi:MAG: nitroreductase family deazaflavin-dependent oxidoreductase [Candidatus Limnocylindrales bacterium]